MDINEFAQKVRSAVVRELGEEYSAEIKEVYKNNGVLMHGLLISSNTCNVAPTIYLEHFFRVYEEGVTFAEVMRRLLETYERDVPARGIDMDFFRDFDKVKDRICYRLVGQAGNQQLLEKIPHVEFLDMAICFFYAYSGETLGEGSILIHNSHVDMWSTNTAELMKLAGDNTPRLFPWRCTTIEELLKEMSDGEGLRGFPAEDVPMKILSNSRRMQGAGCIMYPGVLEQIAKECAADLYILPSSIHEVILLAVNDRETPDELKSMIMQVNRSHVAPEEVLSDSLYRYDRQRKAIEIIF